MSHTYILNKCDDFSINGDISGVILRVFVCLNEDP